MKICPQRRPAFHPFGQRADEQDTRDRDHAQQDDDHDRCRERRSDPPVFQQVRERSEHHADDHREHDRGEDDFANRQYSDYGDCADDQKGDLS